MGIDGDVHHRHVFDALAQKNERCKGNGHILFHGRLSCDNDDCILA